MVEYTRRLRLNKMRGSTSIGCCHEERKTTGHGDDKRTETVRSYTHMKTEVFEYEYCLDRTPAGINCGTFTVVRVDTNVKYEWGNTATKEAFFTMSNKFDARSSDRNRYITRTNTFFVPGIKGKQLIIPEGLTPDQTKYFIRGWYFLSALFFASLLY